VCTLAIYVRAFADFPLIVAANRDEFFTRPTSPPTLLDPVAGIFGGRDEVAGGTWLGVNRAGMVAALLNRRTDQSADPTYPSRGQLCMAMLRSESAAAARRVLEDGRRTRYNPFNLLVADRHGAWIATNHGAAVSVTDLPAGLHLVTNLDVNDPTCPRIAASVQLFAALLGAGAPRPGSDAFREQLRAILSGHDTELDPRTSVFGNSLCLHGDQYGTRSSSVISLDLAGHWTYLHTNEPPCRRDYQPQPVMEALAKS
jgi:uncharacterized protein with NRDE domain